jgi:hypothetical protein
MVKYLCVYYDNVSIAHRVKRDTFKERTVSIEFGLKNFSQRVIIHNPYSTDSLHIKTFYNLNTEDRRDRIILQLKLSNYWMTIKFFRFKSVWSQGLGRSWTDSAQKPNRTVSVLGLLQQGTDNSLSLASFKWRFLKQSKLYWMNSRVLPRSL